MKDDMRKLYVPLVVLMAAPVVAEPLVLAPAAETKVPFTVAKDTTAITSPLNADGTVDYVAAWNQHFGKGVTPEENGWVLWVQAMGKQDLPVKTGGIMYQMAAGAPLPENGEVWQTAYTWFVSEKQMAVLGAEALSDQLLDLRTRVWQARDFPELAEYLAAEKKPLDLATAAALREKWWMPSVSRDGRSLAGVILPGLSSGREVAYTLCARATLRGASGDFAGFLSDVTAVKHLARHVAHEALIGVLVAMVIDQAADQAIAAVAAQGNLTAAQIGAIDKLLEVTGRIDGVHEMVDLEERWAVLDTAAQLAIGRTPMTGEAPGFTGLDPGRVDWDTVLRHLNAEVDDQVRILDLADPAQQTAAWKARNERLHAAGADVPPDPAANAAPKAGESRAAYTQRIGRLIDAEIVPTLDRTGTLRQREILAHELTRTFMAAAAFRERTGHWPEKLGDVAPGDIAALPRDGNGELPVWRVGKAGPLLTAAVDAHTSLMLGSPPP